jgi:O-antigen ligase
MSISTTRLPRAIPGGTTFSRRHPHVAFAVIAAIGILVLAPLLTRPTYAVLVPVVALAAAAAWRSPAIPLALGGIPPLIDAVFGSDPLPKGGFTLLFSAWIAVAVAFVVLRGRHRVAVHALLSVPVLASFFLLGLMLIQLGISPDPAYGNTKVQLYVADVLIFFVGAIFVGSRRRDARLLLTAMLIVTAAGGLLFLFELVTGSAQQVINGRFSLAAQEYPIDLGRASADGLLLAIYFLVTGTRSWARAAVALITPVLLIAMVAAGSRGPVVAFAIGLIALLALSASNPRARRRLAFAGATLALAAIVLPLALPSSSIGRALSTIVGSASGVSSNGRSDLWSAAISAFAQHLPLGIGTGGFAATSAAISAGVQYPHNLILEVASELGLVGLLALVAVLVGLAVRLARLYQSALGPDRLTSTVIIALFLTAVTNSFVSEPIQTNSGIWVWGGLAIGLSAQLATAHRNPRWSVG